MDAVAYVRERQRHGDRISLKHDVFGNYWVVIKRGWLIKRKERVELNRSQFFALAGGPVEGSRSPKIAA